MNSYLKQLLQIHWLRPETALWRSFDCLLMEKYGDISGRSVDLGCGDGTMSFVMSGGIVNEYDVFMDVGELHNYNVGVDIYNQDTNIRLKTDLTHIRPCMGIHTGFVIQFILVIPSGDMTRSNNRNRQCIHCLTFRNGADC